MRIRNVVVSSVVGMVLTSGAVVALTPPPRAATAAPPPEVVVEAAPPAAPAGLPTTFTDGSTLRVEGRLGHARLAKGARGQTYLLVEVRSADGVRAARPAPSHLAVVVDRSGSMKGDRIKNARLAAKAAVDRLGDGDAISVVAFDTRPTVVVPATTIDDSSRARVKTAIDGIALGGDTCISCGIEEGMRELLRSSGKVPRMIVLSDGDATDGVRDVPGFRTLAQRARDTGVAVSTIGVGLGYNQRILGAVAQEANGGHYFIEDAASLERAFQAEAEALRSTIAAEAEAVIDPGEGTEIVRVFDRAFERRGRKIAVKLGAFARDDAKTVLVELSVPASVEGPRAVASVDVGYRDLTDGGQAHVSGALGLEIGDATVNEELDALVAGRLLKSGTGAALLQANELVARGALDEAERVIEQQRRAVAAVAARPRPTVPAGRAGGVDNDLREQAGTLDGASRGFKKTGKKTDVDRSVRHNEQAAIRNFQ